MAHLLAVALLLAATPAELFQNGQDAFYKAKDYVAAEKQFRAAMDHPGATAGEKERAHFWVCVCLGNREKYAQAVEEKKKWLKLYPKGKSRHYLMLFLGDYQRRLGDAKAARQTWATIIREAPESALAKHARKYLGAAQEAVYQADRILPADAGKPGGYLVVAQAFPRAARKIAAHHKGAYVQWDGRDFDALAKALRERSPQNVLFVVSPNFIDVNVHRKILLLSAKLDADIFPDFAFGYFTGRDADAVEELWARTRQLHEKGLSSNRWYATSVASTIKSTVYKDSLPAIARASGFNGQRYYFGSIEADPNAPAFVRKTLAELQEAGVITMTGCGDPQGTWLFNDRRNADRSKHWAYDPEKVGQDPDGEMPRITAGFFKGIHLGNAICWTGVCHAGATRRVFVEGDIVSTFGRTEKATVYDLKPHESYCLAMIDAGAAAFLCPIAANHGMAVSRETDFALEHGATLGETIKSTYDDVYLAARGELVLDIQVEGEAHKSEEYVMQGGGANRILIGDPSLEPFKATPHPQEKVEIRNRREDGFDVVVTWTAGFHARGWDMYGRDRARDWTIRTRIDLAGLVPTGKDLEITATVESDHPYVMAHAEPEVYHGRRYLHLQANAPRTEVMRKATRAVFKVTFQSRRWRK